MSVLRSRGRGHEWTARLLCFLSVCTLLGQVERAQAEAVALDLTACAEPPERDVRTLAALELRGRLVERAPAEAALQIVVRCEDERALLSLSSSGSTSAPRSIDLSTVPEALRARLLALAIAELARAPSEPEPVVEPVLSSEPAPVQSPEPAPARPREPARWNSQIAAGVELQAAPMLLLSGTLSTLVRALGPLGFSGLLSLGQGRREIDLGTLRVRQLGLRAGPAFLFTRPRYRLHAGVAARVSLLALRGEADDRTVATARSFRTVVAGPAVFAGSSLALGRHFMLGLEAELAHLLREVRADVSGARSSTLAPLRVSLSLLLGARW